MSGLTPAQPSALAQRTQLLRALDREITALSAVPPARPCAWDTLLARTAQGIDRVTPDAALATATRALRDTLYRVPGLEAKVDGWWREALTTALYAARIARIKNCSAGGASLAGLLHRSGELLFLRALAAAEAQSAATLDPMTRNRIARAAQRNLSARVFQIWGVAAETAAAAGDWAQCGDFGATTPVAAAVYCAHLLAVETLQPELSMPGLLETLASKMRLDAAHIDDIRGGGLTARELLLALG